MNLSPKKDEFPNFHVPSCGAGETGDCKEGGMHKLSKEESVQIFVVSPTVSSQLIHTIKHCQHSEVMEVIQGNLQKVPETEGETEPGCIYSYSQDGEGKIQGPQRRAGESKDLLQQKVSAV